MTAIQKRASRSVGFFGKSNRAISRPSPPCPRHPRQFIRAPPATAISHFRFGLVPPSNPATHHVSSALGTARRTHHSAHFILHRSRAPAHHPHRHFQSPHDSPLKNARNFQYFVTFRHQRLMKCLVCFSGKMNNKLQSLHPFLCLLFSSREANQFTDDSELSQRFSF